MRLVPELGLPRYRLAVLKEARWMCAPSVPRWLSEGLLWAFFAAVYVPSAVGAVTDPDRAGGASVEGALRAGLLVLVGALVLTGGWRCLRLRSLPLPRQPAVFAAAGLYWLAGAVSLAIHGRTGAQKSMLAVPLLLTAISAFSPSAAVVARLTWIGSVAVCAASLVLALALPEAAFPHGPRFEEARLFGFLIDFRLAGVVSHPNTLGSIAAFAVVLSLARRPRLCCVGLLVSLPTLLLSESRWGMASAGLAAFMLLVVRKRYGLRLCLRGVRAVVAALLLLVICVPLLGAFGLLPGTLNNRTVIWRYGLERFADTPIVGQGPGVWSEFVETGNLLSTGVSGHNQLVDTLVTTGALGFGALALMVALWLRALASGAGDSQAASVAAFVLVLVLAVMEAPFSVWGVGPPLWLLVSALALAPEDESGAGRGRQIPSLTPAQTAPA
jgi:O-antigen ligase